MIQSTKLMILICSLMVLAAVGIQTYNHLSQKTFCHAHADILLIINYNHPYYESIDLLRKIYRPYFPHIVFYGPEHHNDVEFCDHYEGWFSYKAIAQAMQKYPGYAGYLYIHDDLIINPNNFERFDKNNIWIDPFTKVNLELGLDAVKHWPWWPRTVGYSAIKKVYDKLEPSTRTMLADNIGDQMVVYGYSDIVYIPSSCVHEFIKLSNLFEQHHVFLEIALPSICASIMQKEHIEFFKGHAEWGGRNTRTLFNKSLDYIHPIKLSSKSNREFIDRYFQEQA